MKTPESGACPVLPRQVESLSLLQASISQSVQSETGTLNALQPHVASLLLSTLHEPSRCSGEGGEHAFDRHPLFLLSHGGGGAVPNVAATIA